MKLRNRKTGEILYALLGSYPVSGEATIEFMDENSESGYSVYARYKTLAELNEEWEDYKPAEPLIKDEKIRKIIRAWAEVNLVEDVLYDKNKDFIYSAYGSDDTDTSVCISFDDNHVYDELKPRKTYTITELCGEEAE